MTTGYQSNDHADRALEIALRLQECRRKVGMTQRAAGEASGVGCKTISVYECNRRAGRVKIEHLIALLDVYGVGFDEFFSVKTLDDAYVQTLGGERVANLIRRVGALREPWRESALRAFDRLIVEAEGAQRRCGVRTKGNVRIAAS